MAKMLSEVSFTIGNRPPGYMVVLEDGTLVFYTNTGLPVADVGTDWIAYEDLGEFDSVQEFEALAGVRPLIMFDLCDDCRGVRALDGSPCRNCNTMSETESQETET
jgi:hypothetical protein